MKRKESDWREEEEVHMRQRPQPLGHQKRPPHLYYRHGTKVSQGRRRVGVAWDTTTRLRRSRSAVLRWPRGRAPGILSLSAQCPSPTKPHFAIWNIFAPLIQPLSLGQVARRHLGTPLIPCAIALADF